MLKRFYDSAIAIGVQPGEETPENNLQTQTETGTETVQTEQAAETVATEQQVQPVTEFDIDGQKYTIDQIKEWQRGNMRQSDYTRKTQEIAQTRAQQKEALELYEFFQANPQYAEQLLKMAEEVPNVPVKKQNLDPTVQNLALEVTSMRIESELNAIKAKDPEADEIEILKIATEEAVPVKKAYEMWAGRNIDNIVAKRLAKQSAQITENIKKNQQITKTLINPGDKPANVDSGLSDAEKRIADGMGISYEDYAKWKD